MSCADALRAAGVVLTCLAATPGNAGADRSILDVWVHDEAGLNPGDVVIEVYSEPDPSSADVRLTRDGAATWVLTGFGGHSCLFRDPCPGAGAHTYRLVIAGVERHQVRTDVPEAPGCDPTVRWAPMEFFKTPMCVVRRVP